MKNTSGFLYYRLIWFTTRIPCLSQEMKSHVCLCMGFVWLVLYVEIVMVEKSD